MRLHLVMMMGFLAACGGGPGDGDPDTPVNCGFTPAPADFAADLVQVQSPDGAHCVRLLREFIGEDDILYKARPYRIVEMTVGHAGKVETIRDADRLEYLPTHHNWSDQARARVGDMRFELTMNYECCEYGDGEYQLRGLADDGSVLWGPQRLEARTL